MDKLLSMEVFVATVDAGSISAASEAFNISPVMAGKHIRHLEARLGSKLLTRTTRRQSLTEIGRQYYERCRNILSEIKAAESGAEAMRAAPRGTLKVTAPVSFGTQCLAPAVTDYLALHDEVNLDLNLNDRVVDIVEEGYDAAIRIGTLDDSGLVARALQPYRMLICAAPEYLARHGEPRVPADLARHQCLDFLHWNKRLVWQLTDPQGAQSALPASRFRSNNGQALRMAALRGFGIIMQSGILLADDVAAGRLVPILKDYLPAARPIHLVYPRDRQPTPKLTTFVEFVVSRFGLDAEPCAAQHAPKSRPSKRAKG